jgi:hypothetical protein
VTCQSKAFNCEVIISAYLCGHDGGILELLGEWRLRRDSLS